MARQGWKTHERKVAEFFNVKRAIHGIDRVNGEVNTDVFADLDVWAPELVASYDVQTGLVIECKYSTKSSTNSNDWPCRVVSKVLKEPGVKAVKAIPILVTRDGWSLTPLDTFREVFRDLFLPYADAGVLLGYEIRHINKKMSDFYYSAMGQATSAVSQLTTDGVYDRVHPFVCVGSNARLPKVIGWND